MDVWIFKDSSVCDSLDKVVLFFVPKIFQSYHRNRCLLNIAGIFSLQQLNALRIDGP